MDNFIGKFTKRENAQEMIRANAMAEAKEKEKLAAKLAEYELAIQEVRRCSLQNIENAEKVKELLTASLSKIEEAQERETAGDAAVKEAAGEVKTLLAELKERMEELIHAAEDFDHKEAVKVYRNVQAVIEGELQKQTAEIKETVEAAVKRKKQTGLFLICILTFLAAAANVAFEVLKMMGYL